MAAFPLEIWDYPGKLKKVVNQTNKFKLENLVVLQKLVNPVVAEIFQRPRSLNRLQQTRPPAKPPKEAGFGGSRSKSQRRRARF